MAAKAGSLLEKARLEANDLRQQAEQTAKRPLDQVERRIIGAGQAIAAAL